MGCSATKTVPQERLTPDKGHANGKILQSSQHADVKRNTPSAENERHTPDAVGQNGNQPAGQTGGQTGGQTEEKTGGQIIDRTSEQTKDATTKKKTSDLSLSKDLGLRKLQRKETPQAGPLAQNNKSISQSQMEFFKLLDEKIEKGGEIEEEDQVT